MLQDQAAWVWRLREGRSRLPGGMDARIVLPTIQVGHSRGAGGRRRGRGGREGGGEVSWQVGEHQEEVARGIGGGVGGDGRSGMSWELGGKCKRICLHFQVHGSQGMTWLTDFNKASTDLWSYSSAGTPSRSAPAHNSCFQLTLPASALPCSRHCLPTAKALKQKWGELKEEILQYLFQWYLACTGCRYVFTKMKYQSINDVFPYNWCSDD